MEQTIDEAKDLIIILRNSGNSILEYSAEMMERHISKINKGINVAEELLALRVMIKYLCKFATQM